MCSMTLEQDELKFLTFLESSSVHTLFAFNSFFEIRILCTKLAILKCLNEFEILVSISIMTHVLKHLRLFLLYFPPFLRQHDLAKFLSCYPFWQILKYAIPKFNKKFHFRLSPRKPFFSKNTNAKMLKLAWGLQQPLIHH